MQQDPRIEIGNTGLDCGNCGTFQLDRVFFDRENGETLDWLACPHCGYSGHPDEWEPDEWYGHRYGR